MFDIRFGLIFIKSTSYSSWFSFCACSVSLMMTDQVLVRYWIYFGHSVKTTARTERFIGKTSTNPMAFNNNLDSYFIYCWSRIFESLPLIREYCCRNEIAGYFHTHDTRWIKKKTVAVEHLTPRIFTLIF